MYFSYVSMKVVRFAEWYSWEYWPSWMLHLKMKVKWSFQTSGATDTATQRNIPQDQNPPYAAAYN